jgi:hypothetical protein
MKKRENDEHLLSFATEAFSSFLSMNAKGKHMYPHNVVDLTELSLL